MDTARSATNTIHVRTFIPILNQVGTIAEKSKLFGHTSVVTTDDEYGKKTIQDVQEIPMLRLRICARRGHYG